MPDNAIDYKGYLEKVNLDFMAAFNLFEFSQRPNANFHTDIGGQLMRTYSNILNLKFEPLTNLWIEK